MAKGVKGKKLAAHDQIPGWPLTKVAEAYGMGEGKYEKYNWADGYEWSKSYSAMQRHALAFWAGEDLDKESGLPHLAHVAWHAFTLMEFMRCYPEYDDRPPLKADLDSPLLNQHEIDSLKEKNG